MRRRRRSSGFALLLSLALVLLAGSALAAAARRSVVAAVGAQGDLAELQRRWAMISCRDTLLPRAEALLSKRRGEPVAAERRFVCRLAGVEYELIVTDEQGKVNLNRLLAGGEEREASAVAAALTAAARRACDPPVEIELRPRPAEAGPTTQPNAAPRLVSYGQVFVAAAPADLAGDAPHRAVAGTVTCWSDGAVNIRRASDEVVSHACDGHLGPEVVRDLLAARRRDPTATLESLLAAADGINDRHKAIVRQILTDRSRCHGLWVVAHGPQRSWYRFAVRTDTGDGPGRVHEFTW
jgi:hypothetical protein